MTATPQSNRDILIDAINHERDGLRAEIIEYERSMHRAVLAFVTVAGIAAGFYFQKTGALDPSEKSTIFFMLSQVECFLSLFGIQLIAAQNMHAGYIRALEKKLNQLSGGTISIWESEIVPRYMGHPRGSFFWANVLFILSLVIVFVLFVYAAFSHINQMVYGIVLVVELLALLILLLFVAFDPDKIAKFAESRLAP